MILQPVNMILYKVLLTTVWTNEIAAIYRSYNKNDTQSHHNSVSVNVMKIHHCDKPFARKF
jgi:hypothetical protein